jgi:uracil-DNA glycosylase family 4
MLKKHTHVPPSGDPKTARYIIVGEFPEKSDVIQGRAFISPTGRELDNCLHSAGISRSDCYFTYVIKDVDRPIGHYLEVTKKGIVIHEEGQEYVNLLASELANCTSNCILAIGNLSMFALTDRGSGIGRWRGSVLDATLLSNKKVIPTINPATIAERQYKNKRLIIYDLLRMKKVVEGNWHPIPREIKIRPTLSECLQFLYVCECYGKLGTPIAYDIEVDVFNGEMTCISFAYSPTDCMSIPFIAEGGDYFTITQEAEILIRIARLLEDPEISILGQNLSFDCTYMLRKYGIHTSNFHDTMVAQKTLMPDYPVGLHFVCSLWTELPYYKDDGKYWLKGVGSFEGGWRYNALDSIVCAEAYPKQLEELRKQHNLSAYYRKTKSILPYVYIMEHGIRINTTTMKASYDNIRVEIQRLLVELHSLCGFELNPDSPKQVANYFYKTKKLPAYKNKDGGETTDEKALKRISRKGHPEASIILRIRGLGKESATFLDPNKVDADGRMRCSYNPVGTRFSRASSSENIFGTGNNLQNQPHSVLTHFLADPNYVFYGMDLSQAENRIVAYVGRIEQMIECFETAQDVHGLTAKIMMVIHYGQKTADKLMETTGVKTPAPIGDGKKTWRDWGKKANHGLNYDLGFKTFALYNELPERDSKTIVDIYHRAYPGVRNGFHSHVQSCINRNRTLTNLMGRKTLFLDIIGDALYKGAYSCIPQGTVGDIIDERGLNYIYYNPDPLFKYVELLIQVHDQIGFQIPTPYHPTRPCSWAEHSIIINKIKRSLETPLYTHYGRKFIIPVDITMGRSLNKELGFDPKDTSPRELQRCFAKCCMKNTSTKMEI